MTDAWLVESRMLGNGHVRFGGRGRETDRPKGQHRALPRPITYLRVADRFLYLATVLDLHSRRLIGWSLAEHARATLVSDALDAAVAARGGEVAGVIFHTDHGGQGGFNWSSQRCLAGGSVGDR